SGGGQEIPRAPPIRPFRGHRRVPMGGFLRRGPERKPQPSPAQTAEGVAEAGPEYIGQGFVVVDATHRSGGSLGGRERALLAPGRYGLAYQAKPVLTP